MKKKILVISIISVVCIGIIAGISVHLLGKDDLEICSTHSDYVKLSADELENESDIIIVGKFTGEKRQVIPDKNVAPDVMSSVYTYHTFEVISQYKGDVQDEITIRQSYGQIDNKLYLDSNSPEFEEGEKYLLYLKKGKKLVKDDIDNYYLFGGPQNCIEIDDSGKLDLRGKDASDAQKIEAMYDSTDVENVAE